jgi:hypothetical protein
MRIVDYIDLYKRAVSFVALIALTTAFSMVSLAATRPVGELIVRPARTAAENASVTVDGERAASGRTLFVSSVIATPNEFGATVNLGKLGRIELAPDTKFTLADDSSDTIGYLGSGSITAYGAAPLAVKTANGSIVRLNAGETVDANASVPAQKSSGSFPAWGWAVLVGVVIGVTVVALAAGGGNNNNASPVR